MDNMWHYSTYSKIDSIVKSKFPFKTPRENQLETISEIKEAVDKGYKYIILEAGTGTGKSLIAATLASIYDSTYIFTVTKQLQEQYLDDFKNLGFKVVKGRGNFKCKKYLQDDIDYNCDEGRCILEGYNCEFSVKRHPDDVNHDNTCFYEYQKWIALNSNIVISNYHYLFLELNYNQSFGKRKLLVFDEAHNLESVIMSQLKLEFTRKELKDHLTINLSKEAVNNLKNGDYNYWIQFIEIIKDKYSIELKKIKKIKNKKGIKEKIAFLKRKINDCNIFINQIKKDPSKWIFDYDSRYGVAEFKPIKVDNYATTTLFRHGDICLFMSATILDYKLFANWLGINEDEIYAIRRKSPFEINRNPIITYDNFNMSYNSLKSTAPQTVNTIKNILNEHKDEKGIIHTISHKCKIFLKNNINDSRLIDHKTANRSKQLEKFKNSDKPLVLISPSMNEGVDLPGDLCRFQIIYKIPFPNLGDKQTKKRKEMDPQWYNYKTSLALVQTYGRGMRYKRDFCKTYFIDSRLKSFVYQDELNDNFLPDFFKKAININPAKISIEDYNYRPVETKKAKNEKVSTEIKKDFSKEYFYHLANKIKNQPGFTSDKDLSKHVESDFIEFNDIGSLNEKYNLIKKGKELEKENPLKAVTFYDTLKNNEYFNHDYYPYRRQCILFKNKIKDPHKDWETIIEIFSNKIYCNKHQYIWLNNKILELIDKLELKSDEISKIGRLLQYYSENEEQYKNLQENSFPIAERIFKDENGLKLISEEKYNYVQNVYRVKELGVGYIRREDYNNAIKYYVNLLNEDFLYYKYHAYKQLGKIFDKINDYNKFKEIYKKYSKL